MRLIRQPRRPPAPMSEWRTRFRELLSIGCRTLVVKGAGFLTEKSAPFTKNREGCATRILGVDVCKKNWRF